MGLPHAHLENVNRFSLMSNMLTPQDLKNNGALHATVQDIYFDYSKDEEQKSRRGL